MSRTRVDVVCLGSRYRGWLETSTHLVVFSQDTLQGACDYRSPEPWHRLLRWHWSGPVEVTGVPELMVWKTMREAIEGARG
jgi:hypothetical protein